MTARVALPVPGRPATSLDEAVERMEAIGAQLPASDGLACFNHMYLGVTVAVRERVVSRDFADPAFVGHLDVVFANLYLEAVDALASGTTVPKAWQPLISARSDTDVEPIQFALAGMNAHINHDLPIAVTQACRDLGTAPTDGQHHADYQKVDALLDAAEQSIRQSFESGVVLAADRHAQAVLDLVCNWSMNSAAAVAWDTALALWTVRHNTWAAGLLTGALARTVGMASRMLLVAV